MDVLTRCSGDTKFPTAVRYDRTGRALSFGAEAVEQESDAPDHSILLRYFKLRLHTKDMIEGCYLKVPDLPPNVTDERVSADFLRYTFDHCIDFFKNSTPDGATIWNWLKGNFQLVYAVPNAWTEKQHLFLRFATGMAGIILPSKTTED